MKSNLLQDSTIADIKVSDYLELIHCIYEDACIKCIADVSDLRDWLTIQARVKTEGLSFLTITLPAFCKDFDRSLALGHIDPTAFRNFRKVGAIPAFLRGMLGLVFDHETGRILYDSQSTCETSREIISVIEAVRQICMAFRKLRIACTPERVKQTLEKFIETELSFKSFQLQDVDIRRFRHVSAVLWGGLLGDLRLDELLPRHGPGATAERISGNSKFVWLNWHERLEPYFPLIESGYSISAFQSEELEQVKFVSQEQEQPVRVITVPKTLKGPRIIAIEPCCMQYAQQGVLRVLVSALETYWVSAGHINFRDQRINQALAISSSNTGLLATIDLSDASDRVPFDLAMEMFVSNPDLKDAIIACRSTRAQMPDGTVIGPLGKFASMGSALCFPVESMYFYTICVMALLESKNLPVTQANCLLVSRDVHVYGDDIIVPSTNAMTVLEHLRKYNCKVNDAKTFLSGNFRESCGVDAFAGIEVTPLYVTRRVPENRQHVSELVSFVSLANAFYKKGYWRTAQHLYEVVERILGPLPYVHELSQTLGRKSYLGYRSVERWSEKLHRFEIKGWIPSPVYRTDRLEGYGALQKSLRKLQDLSSLDDSREARPLEHSAQYGAVVLKRRWVPST